MNGLALCAGAAGLELGLAAAIGEHYRTVAYVEQSVEAAAILADHMEAALLDPAPIWDDVKTFDGRRWRGLVDIVSGGFPCQPFSMAGKRRGVEDPRHLWPYIANIIRDCEPGLVFLENVPGLLTTLTPDGRYAYEHVEGDLRDMGFSVEAGIFSAAEVGAPHNRERIFILGHAGHSTRSTEQRQQPQGTGGRAGESSEATVADTLSERGCSRDGEREDAVHAFPPGPTGDWSDIPQRLWPAVKPGFRDVADELAGRVAALSRAQELRILGNGVVVATAERAFSVLSDRIGGIK